MFPGTEKSSGENPEQGVGAQRPWRRRIHLVIERLACRRAARSRGAARSIRRTDRRRPPSRSNTAPVSATCGAKRCFLADALDEFDARKSRVDRLTMRLQVGGGRAEKDFQDCPGHRDHPEGRSPPPVATLCRFFSLPAIAVALSLWRAIDAAWQQGPLHGSSERSDPAVCVMAETGRSA